MKAGRASSTAKVIAASTILLACEKHGRPMVPAGAADLCRVFLSTCLPDRCLARCCGRVSGRWFLRVLEQCTLPGIISHYWRRKRWIERRCRAAIGDGFDQIVIVGAGFDTLGMRLAGEFQNVHFTEMDHPATQEVKKTALARHEIETPSNLKFLPLDLTNEKFPEIRQAEVGTLLIMEGLLMYLSNPQIDSLFASLRESWSGKLRVIFSFMSRWPDGGSGFRPHSRLVDRWLGWKREPFMWTIEPEAIGGFLASRGFRLRDMAVSGELEEDPTMPSCGLEGENFVNCEPVRI